MKQQRFRFKLLALLLFGLFALLAVYGVYSINTYGNRWFAYARNPRVREQKANVTACASSSTPCAPPWRASAYTRRMRPPAAPSCM